MISPVIRLHQVVAYAGERAILDSVSLEVRPGERLAIIGRNGAGKSSLLKLLTGKITPSYGKAQVLQWELDGRLSHRDRMALHAQVGQVFQGLHLVQRLTALENVLLGSLGRNTSWLTWARIFPRQEVLLAMSLLERAGLVGKAHVRTDRLSGGERQKVAISRMLMQRPRLILADEPTAALDPVASAEVAALLSSLTQNRQSTLISVVHDPGLLPILADRVIGLRQGRIVFDLPVEELGDDKLNMLYRDGKPEGWIARLDGFALPVGEKS